MKKTYTSPISSETFQEVWQFTDEKRREAKRKVAVKKTAGIFGNLTFLALCILFAFRLFQNVESAAFQEYLLSLRFLAVLWEFVSDLVIFPGLSIVVQILLIAVFIYLVSFAVSAAAGGLAWCVYRPKARPAPAGSPADDSKLLHNTARQLSVFVRRLNNLMGALLHTSLFLLFCGGIVIGFAFYAFSNNDSALLDRILNGLTPLVLLLGSTLPFVAYAVFNYPFLKLLQLIYRCHFPESLISDTMAWRLQCDPEEKARLEEEDRILQLAKEITERRKKEEAELRR